VASFNLMKILLFLFLLVIGIQSIAQKVPIKFGDVSMEELKMRIYPKDSSAEAVVLADFGESSINYSDTKYFRLTFERITRIKILKKGGYKWADFKIPLYEYGGEEEEYTNLKAYTYNLQGGKIEETRMKSDVVFVEQTTDNWKQVKFTLPNVKEGSVVEVTYRISSPFLANFQDWIFQSQIPTKISEYRASIPDFFDYQKYQQGYIGLNINETKTTPRVLTVTSKDREGVYITKTTFNTENIRYQELQHRWVATDVPAFIFEPHMTSYNDLVSKLNFELAFIKRPNSPIRSFIGTWEGINKQLIEHPQFGQVIDGANFLNKKVDELTAGLKDADKIVKIYNYIKENVIWDGRIRRYTAGNFRKVLDEGKGSSADINLLLTSMLRKAEFTAEPVVISTRDHGMIRENVPVLTQFNYVICLVTDGDKTILLDATDRSLPMSILPERCLNGNGLVISKTNSKWVSLSSNSRSKSSTEFEVSLAEEGSSKGKITITSAGYHAQDVRNSYKGLGEEKYLTMMSSTHSWEIEKSEFENITKAMETVKETYQAKMENFAQVAGSVMYINPIVNERIEKNPFRLEKREYPVDFGSPFEKLVRGKITIPDTFVVEEMPKPKIVMLPNNAGKYTYSISQLGNTISVLSHLVINKSFIPQNEYNWLKEFYNQVVAKQAEQIVIKKK
jgi:Domain of Unknown Function with PDB structure (DUF3857)/Transglutaminase-like superfamily